MRINIMFHCGNAPKMERVIDLMVALAKKQSAKVKIHVREDFMWSTVGDDEAIRYDELDDKLPSRPDVKTLTVDNALSHGNGAMCEGELVFDDNDKLRFCTVVQFTSTAKDAVVKSAHTYFVKC